MELALVVSADSTIAVERNLTALLDLFRSHQVTATILLHFGAPLDPPAVRGNAAPGLSGGFLRRAARRLLPALAPDPIGSRVTPIAMTARDEGHELGLRPFDLTSFGDGIDGNDESALRRNLLQATRCFEAEIGDKPNGFAAPFWRASSILFSLEDELGFLWGNDTRGTGPYFPKSDARVFGTPQLPTTLPTWDEVLGSPGLDEASLLDFYSSSVREGIAQVHRLHAEIEGGSHIGLFERLLLRWKRDGIRFVRLETVARRALARRKVLPRRFVVDREIPGRVGRVSCEG